MTHNDCKAWPGTCDWEDCENAKRPTNRTRCNWGSAGPCTCSRYGAKLIKPKKIYVIGSMRNPEIPQVANALRAAGYDAFDDWYSPGPDTDDRWKEYEAIRGRSYQDAILGHHAEHAFELDYKHLSESDAAVLVLPAGKSAHMELGWFCYTNPGFILFNGEPEPDRYELMYRFVFKTGGDIVFSVPALLEKLSKL